MNNRIIAVLVVMAVIVTTLIVLDDDVDSELKGKDTRQIVEELENTVGGDLSGIVYQDYIEITKGNDTVQIHDEKDMFYVSIAPYISSTHS